MSSWERYKAVSVGWHEDGHPHERTEAGFCQSCGARPGEAHYRLVPKAETGTIDTPSESE